MSAEDLSKRTAYLVAQICKAYRQTVSRELGPLGLHAGQEMLLCELWQNDGLTQSELGERMGVQPATVSKMLSRMDKAGLVSGCRDAADGRIVRLHLTEAGQALHQPIQEVQARVDAQIVANLTLEEQVLVHRLLVEVLHNLTKVA